MCVLKMKFLSSVVQKLSSEHTDRWTDRQTDRQAQLKLLPIAYADGNNIPISDFRSFLYLLICLAKTYLDKIDVAVFDLLFNSCI